MSALKLPFLGVLELVYTNIHCDPRQQARQKGGFGNKFVLVKEVDHAGQDPGEMCGRGGG
jgi:hypothetical protein